MLASAVVLVPFGAAWLLGGQALAQTDLGSIARLTDVVWIWIVAMFLAIAFSALYVGAETALDLLRPMHVKFAKDKDPKRAERLEWLLNHRSSLVAACILGRQSFKLAMVFFGFTLGNSAAAAAMADPNPPLSVVILYALAIVAPVGLLSMVIDLVPKSYATLHPHRVAGRLYGFMRASWVVFGILAAFVTFVANLLTSRFGGQATFEIPNPVEEEIKTMVESAEESGEIEGDERELLHSVFEFTDTVAREIMTPRVDLDSMPVKSDPAEVIKVIRETGHSRIPLFEDTDDQIVGVIHAKDLLLAALDDKPINLRSLMRPAMFV
ncbi:MAG: magnesium and cobalt exporter, family, partial [Fimbriimonadaceae bacterium]|nr:magnesium and cobalt exporter, family [Fimbriimonadaceae bacterium]